MFKRTNFQHGSLKREKRKLGPDVWIYRWREIGPDGICRKPKVIIGTVHQFPAKRSPGARSKTSDLESMAGSTSRIGRKRWNNS